MELRSGSSARIPGPATTLEREARSSGAHAPGAAEMGQERVHPRAAFDVRPTVDRPRIPDEFRLNPIRTGSRSSFPETMGRAGTTQAQRRSEAAPLALALVGWVLALAPIAHPLLAHGAPFLRTTLDDGWVHHPGERQSPGPSAPP